MINLAKLDPSRTLTLRKAFEREVGKRFNKLKAKILRLMSVEDAFALLKKNRHPTFNVFCPTGPGGGVDPTCSPKGRRKKLRGDGGITPTGSTVGTLSHSQVVEEVTRLRDSWGYKEMVSLVGGEGKQFERGGKSWKEGGNCVLQGEYVGHVTIYTANWADNNAVRHIAAHEFMHGTYEKVHIQFREEQSQLASYHVKANGDLKPEFANQFPTYHKLNKYINNYERQEADDGITDYSKAYWQDYSARTVTQHIAAHETLAEIAGIHESTGVIQGSKFYRDFYKDVRDEYRVLTGDKKRRKVKTPTTNLATLQSAKFVNHDLMLGADFQPTESFPSYLRYWRYNGDNGFAVLSHGLTANVRWKFNTTPEQVEQFRQWLSSEIDNEILSDPETTEDDWWDEYVKEGYKKGAGRAFDDVNKPAKATREGRVSDFYLGSKDQFLRSSFANPQSKDKLKLLSGRVYTDLKGVTDAMATVMTRVLTDGLSQGKNPRDIARDLVKAIESIGKARAQTIARTEVIRAHAEGQLDALEQMGIEEIGVAVEWLTAGNVMRGSPVCPLCKALEGIVLKVKEAHGLIPRHPNCRCAFMPANVGEPAEKQQKKSAKSIDKAIDKSIELESSDEDKTLEEKRKDSRWQGADLDVDEERPKSILNSLFHYFFG